MIQDATPSIMAQDSSSWRVRPRVSPRVAIEAPRMFSSFPRAMRELFQNAHRAGATRVDVRWDPRSATLEIEDDGAGIHDPQILLDAGASGWDQKSVIEPAGLGFFSLFNPAYVEWIEITSRGAGNWHLRLEPTDIRRAIEDENVWIPVEPVAETERAHGLCVRLGVNDKEIRRLDRETIVEVRAQYPYTVFYTEGEQTVEVLPRKYGSSVTTIETAVGPIEWEIPYGEGYRHGRACWEFVPFFSDHLNKALQEAAESHPLAALAEMAAHSLTIWYIEPACGVRPQLPERGELIQDDALRAAANVIVESIVSDILTRAREDFREAPTRFVSTHCLQAPYGKWLERGKFTQVLLKSLGYALVEQYSGDVWVETLDENSWQPHLESTLIYNRTAQIVGDEHLAATLNFLGKEVAYEQGAPVPEIHINGCRADVEICPYLALADRIEVDGIGDVPFLITEHEESGDTRTKLVFVGSAEACVEWLYSKGWPIGYLFVANENAEWASRDGDDVTFERDQALEEVATCIARAWSPELEAALRLHYDLQRAIAHLKEAERNVESAARGLRNHRSPMTNICHRSLKGMRARMEYTRTLMQEAVTPSAPVVVRQESAE
ncbi:MAG: ATP-binding protein [Anaerolineae bacterium]|nr:ATP-binding protein [Anaerolineae bacterium]